jgi:molybdate transport system substrate-binding protein
VQPVTREPDVRAVLAKVTGDDVDAGIVYRSDVVAAGAAVEEVPVPTNINVTTRYPIVLIAGRPNEAAAARFVAYLRSAAGKRILIANGFTPASS